MFFSGDRTKSARHCHARNTFGSVTSFLFNMLLDGKGNDSLLNVETPEIKVVMEAACVDANMNKTHSRNSSEDFTDPCRPEAPAPSAPTDFSPSIRWLDLLVQVFLHVGCVYGAYLMLTSAKLKTSIWAFVVVYTSGFGITAGAHRLWSHRAYKAKWPLRLLLILLFTVTGQRHVYQWALDHRVHHKFSETNADPHNAKRGFLFSHVGWLVLTPHPDVVTKRKLVDMSDLEADAIVMWQKRYYVPLFALLALILPVWVPWYFWKENIWTAFFVLFNFRFCLTLNIAFFVNSVAHMWGQKPYDKNISPVENVAVSIAALGEGWHNYHHVFPYDYKTAELGHYSLNLTTGFIDFFAWLGWASDRKTVSDEMIRRRVERSGDGSHNLWGWGDKDISKEEEKTVVQLDRKEKCL